MSSESDEFALGTIGELQDRNGWTADNWVSPHIESGNVPFDLRQLIPLARRWGITCDATRADAASKATKPELDELCQLLSTTHSLYEDWCFGAIESFDLNSTECSIFGAMYRFESEACDGRGIRSRLDWAISRFEHAPNEDNRLHLQSALDWVVAKGRRFCKSRQKSIDAAHLLLNYNHVPVNPEN